MKNRRTSKYILAILIVVLMISAIYILDSRKKVEAVNIQLYSDFMHSYLMTSSSFFWDVINHGNVSNYKIQVYETERVQAKNLLEYNGAGDLFDDSEKYISKYFIALSEYVEDDTVLDDEDMKFIAKLNNRRMIFKGQLNYVNDLISTNDVNREDFVNIINKYIVVFYSFEDDNIDYLTEAIARFQNK